ncbi:uncharacterized protein LOC108906271 [Anoplophora glabripennis]|nr:uncharacterized protein LOC108906271 [Anoplophora glabripennis]
MLRLLAAVIAIQTVSSNLNTSDQSEVDIFSDPGVQFERIQNALPNHSTKKYEIIRNFLTHYNSLKPVAVLVDDTKESHDDANNFLGRVFELTSNAKYIPFSLRIFNTTSVTPPVAVKGNKTFQILLDYTEDRGKMNLDPAESNGTAAFFAVLNAANVLPQESAILIFIDRKVADEDLAPHIALLRKKNIKVYVVWGGSYPSKYSEDHLLRELCEYSGGIFYVDTGKDLSDYYYRQFLSDRNSHLNASIIMSKNNLMDASELTFPIDSNVTGIHVRIAPFVSSGSISTPKGYVINVLRKEEIARYSTGSFDVIETGFHVFHLNITTAPTHDVGIWRLKLANTLAPYNVTVFAYTKLIAQAYFTQKYAGHQNSTGSDRKVMKLGISAYITSISNISFVDKDGQPIIDKTKYTLVKDSIAENNISHRDREIDVEFYSTPEKPAYALIHGKDSEGNDFSRLTYISYSSNEIFPQPTLTIEVGAGSELITTGGKFPVIIFEVTNHKNTAVDVRFTCKDEKSILRFLKPYRQIIGPEETAIIRLTLITGFGSYEDEITFTAWIGSELFKKKVIVDVRNQALIDNDSPELDYSFSSDCSKFIFSKCSEGTWTVKITAKDTGSGLLQVSSYPKGLYFPNDYTTGTRDEVTGYYSGSCCNPDFQVTALDRLNNRKVINTNAYQAFWGPAQIAALVLGILIFISIIVLIVYIVIKCRKDGDSYNLPTYRGGRI